MFTFLFMFGKPDCTVIVFISTGLKLGNLTSFSLTLILLKKRKPTIENSDHSDQMASEAIRLGYTLFVIEFSNLN